MIIKIGNEKAERAEWDAFVETSGGCVFQTIAWGDILRKTYGYRMEYFMEREDDGEIGWVLPSALTRNPLRKRLISIPFSDYAGPLARDADAHKDAVGFAVKKAKEQKATLEMYSLRKQTGLENLHMADTFVLDVRDGYESVWEKRVDRKTRNLVRKAGKEGVTVHEEDGATALDEYYHIYLGTMKKLGAMPHGRELFRNVKKEFGEKARLYSAKRGGKMIAGMLTLEFNGTMHVWSNASLAEALRFAPNDALYDHAIREACILGLDRVDFGSTPLDSGHHAFKEGWGGETKPVYLAGTKRRDGGRVGGQEGLKKMFVKGMPKPLLGTISPMLFRYAY